MKKPGPKPKSFVDLRLKGVKVFFSAGELADLDSRRAHHQRGEFLRTAGLCQQLTAPLPRELLTTWSESARIAACLTQINQVALNLNQINLSGGQLEAAQALLEQLPEVAFVLAEFRAELSDAKLSRVRS